MPGSLPIPITPGPRTTGTPFKGDLVRGFRYLCAYSAIFEPVGTVDHFVSCHEDRSKAYDWENYRFSAAWFNSSKGNLTAGDLLDPFDIEDG